jgi:DNA-binding IscR family transcriptional regulator
MGRVAAALREQGWIAAVEGANNRYVLSRAADQIRLGPLSVSQAGAVPDGCDHEVHRILAEVTARQREIWEDRTLASLRVVTQNGD